MAKQPNISLMAAVVTKLGDKGRRPGAQNGSKQAELG